MVKLLIVNEREEVQKSGRVRVICNVVEDSPEYSDPRPVKNMQGVTIESAREYIANRERWDKNWVPGF
jgi:hypothetical protein